MWKPTAKLTCEPHSDVRCYAAMNDVDRILNWLILRTTPGMTRPRLYNLMQLFDKPEDVFGASAGAIGAVRGFDRELARALLARESADVARRQYDALLTMGARVLTRHDTDYPQNLRESALEPPLLFVLGTLASEDRYSVAMVGSRHATQYGRAVAGELAAGLARSGITVVSGFARGVDGEAHHAALKAGGRTIAVLGNGLDVCYPSEHRALGERIAEGGALVTEYPLGTSPDRYNFPERNHVIAALSLGTVVVEAAEKSGSLITARLALDENRFIFAVPGDVTRNNSRGANALIQQGARLVQRSRDVLVEMRHVLRGYLDEDLLTEEDEPAATPAPKRSARSRTADAGNEPVSADDAPAPVKAPPPKPKAPLTAEETIIVGLLRHEAMVFDELAAHCFGEGIDVPRLTSLLMKLELRQVIRQLPGRYYVLFT